MATIDVKDAADATVAIEKPLAPGRAAATASRPIVLSTEDKTALDALATQTTLAAVLAKIIAAPATEAKQDTANTSLSSIASLLTTQAGFLDGIETLLGANASQTTLAAILAKIIATPATEAKQDTQITALGTLATQTTLAAVLAKIIAAPATEAKQDNAITQETAINTVLGVKGDAKSTATDTTAISAMSVWKQISASIQLFVFGAGTAAAAQRTTLASDDPAVATLGATSGAAVITDANGTVQQYLRGLIVQWIAGTLKIAGGAVAHDGADSGNPLKVGGRARASELAAVAENDRSDFITDLVGKQIVLPYANPENFVSGAITSAMTGTTSTSLVAAPGAGLRNYITSIIVSNAHATVGTDVIIQDGSGGTTLMTIPAAAVYGGAVINLPVPLKQPTANTALFCANVTTGASTKASAVGYKGA